MITASVFAMKSDYAVSNIMIWHFKNNGFRHFIYGFHQNPHLAEPIWYTVQEINQVLDFTKNTRLLKFIKRQWKMKKLDGLYTTKYHKGNVSDVLNNWCENNRVHNDVTIKKLDQNMYT